MVKTLTFPKGGVHPPGNKSLSSNAAVIRLTPPPIGTVPMAQHLGAPAAVCVAKGDTVSAGQKIGSGESFISADVHTPVSGTVKEIVRLMLPNSGSCDAVVIDTAQDEEPELFALTPGNPVQELSPRELIGIVKEAGIVGMGGAAFPAHVKFQIPKGKKAEFLVINGVECEPYLTSDHRVMLEHPREVLKGISAAAKMIGAEQVVIGIEANKMDAVSLLQRVAEEEHLSYLVQPLKVKYPQGDEKQLLKATIRREVPSGGLPIDIGAVVTNVGTAYAIYEAVYRKKPLFERVVTVTGDAVNSPGNFRTVVGTPVRTLIEAAGGFSRVPSKIIAGGPMMGFAFFDLDSPVTKGTSGILVLSQEGKKTSLFSREAEQICISCGKCVAACPMGLQPTKLFRYIENSRFDEAMKLNLMDCKECGCCAFICPAKLPLVHGFRYGKKMARKKQ